MPNEKITEMSPILAANLVDADVVEIVDISANGGAGTNFKITVGELRTLITNALIIGTDVQSWAAVLDATTASYTTALDTKLGTIETSADVTDADNVNSSGAVMESDFTSARSILVQQSGTGSPEVLSIATNTIVGRITGGASEIDDLSPSQVRLLLNVEDGADVTDTTNVTNAGALMDSEVTNLDEVKAFDSTDYAAALGADDNYVTDAEKIVIGNTSGTNTGDQDISGKQDILSEGAFVDGDKTKLDGIETGADVTDATNVAATGAVIPTGTPDGTKFLRDDEVWTTIPGGGDALTTSPLSQFASTTSLQLLGVISDETGTGALVFGTSPTLVTPNLGTPSVLIGTNITGTAAGLTVGATTGVEAGADVTDTENVTAAGALMDSEVVNLAQVKAFDSTDYAAALGVDDNYVTDAEKIVIGNTSGTNTGDQDISGKQNILAEGAFVDGDKTKLDGIEAGADVTDATNVAATGAVIPTGTPDGTKFLRDDEVWTTIPGGGDALTSNPLSQFAATTSAQLLGVMSDETGTGALVFATSPTLVTPNLGTPTTLVGTNITGTAAGLTVGATTGVEAGADVTDTANVTAAGALMDSEVTNLAQVKAFDSADYATAAQGTKADDALPTTGGTLTGDLTIVDTTSGSAAGPELTLTRDITGVDGNYLGQLRFLGNNDLDQSNVYAKITAKISDATDTTEDGLIEFALRKDGSNAIVGRLTSTDLKLINGTGLEVDGDILASGTVDGRDIATDGTKLDTIATNADVTDSTSVTAAGALMDSELTSIADVKALNQSLVSGAAPVLDATNFTNLPASGSPTQDTTAATSVLVMDNSSGNYYTGTSGAAKTLTTYTTSTNSLGGFAQVLINTTSQPTVTGGTLITGATWEISTNMYMIVTYNGTRIEYFFLEI